MAQKMKVKKAKKVAVQSKESFLLTMSILVQGPTIDEASLLARATKRTRVFENAFRGAKSVKLSEINMKRV